MKILRNLADRLSVVATMIFLLLPASAFAQDGEMDYGNANEVPLVDGVGLLLVGVLLAALAVWALRRSAGRGGHAAGMLLAAAALSAGTLGVVNIQEVLAGQAPIELDNSSGGTVPVPYVLYQEYVNTTIVPLLILSIRWPECQQMGMGQMSATASSHFQPMNGFPECLQGQTILQPGETCYLDGVTNCN